MSQHSDSVVEFRGIRAFRKSINSTKKKKYRGLSAKCAQDKTRQTLKEYLNNIYRNEGPVLVLSHSCSRSCS